ncbi:MAG: GGDEF domain-containing protein [Oscillospiraceae bacterium]
MNFMTGSLNNFPFFITLYMTMLVGNMVIILMSKEKTDESIANAATYDDLTGIFNRRTFLAYTRDNIALFTKRQKPISFLIMDLDHFKKINDQHGHFVGDIVLKDFAATISAQLRQEDIFGRIGGEEFTVLLPGTSGTEAVIIAERLKSSIEKSVVNDIHYTVSIGVVTVIPTETTTADLLYKTGDEALYIAKSKGRNRIEVAKTD